MEAATYLPPSVKGVDRKGWVPVPHPGVPLFKKSYHGSSVLSTSLGSKTLNTSLGLGGGGGGGATIYLANWQICALNFR